MWCPYGQQCLKAPICCIPPKKSVKVRHRAKATYVMRHHASTCEGVEEFDQLLKSRCLEAGITQGPAGIVAGRDGLLGDGCRLQLFHGQLQQLRGSRADVVGTYLSQITHQGKSTLSYVS